MKKAGGIIAIIAGIFGVLGAGATLFLGGLGAALESEGSDTIVGLGWGGVVFSFAAIVLGAVALGAKGRLPGILLIICAVLGAVLGGTLVAVFMVLALVGGVLTVLGTKTPAPNVAVAQYPMAPPTGPAA